MKKATKEIYYFISPEGGLLVLKIRNAHLRKIALGLANKRHMVELSRRARRKFQWL